ncbi:MAG TPA: T9SS type A sorting domain-containing protein [Bacteroidia bacterium]|jgi:hypothetical protein|nr:T9SS type A sorting domain-containing protein [Bacteroidia bacterium]
MDHLKKRTTQLAQQQLKGKKHLVSPNSQILNNYSHEGTYLINYRKKIILSFALIIFTCTLHLYAQSSAKLELGTPQSVINGVVKQHSRSAKNLTFQLNSNSVAEINVLTYFYQNDKISIHGKAKESNNSSFILKGSPSTLYGYYVLHDSKKAYEITTANGIVYITEINIAKIYPDRYTSEINPKTQNAPLAAVLPVYSSMAQRQAVHIGPYNNEDVTKLQSKPGSPYVFYLHMTEVMNGDTPKNGITKEAVYRAWQCVSDQYSMFNLNITTDPSVYEAAKNADVLKTGIIDFIDADGISHACVSCFGTTEAGTLFRGNPQKNDYGYEIGRTCSHEMGHQMGLMHDGGSTQPDPEYFVGLSAVEWCPIMGNYWYGDYWSNQLYTWSKGEYNTATNTEDDLSIMNVNENVPYMNDDNPSSKNLTVGKGGTVSSAANWGQIERNTDVDNFTFSIASGGGTVNLRIDPLEYLRQLDVAARIIDTKGVIVASSNLSKNRSAEFKNLPLAEGTYTLVIQGGSELTPQTGFSNYSSLGYYGIEGTIVGGVVTSVNDPTLDDFIVAFPNPTNDILNLSYSNSYPNVKITLTTITGQTLFVSDKFVSSIDLSTFAKGIYLLKISVEQGSFVKRISKL